LSDNIHLPVINLCPTMRCNLKCSLCGVLVPQYEYRPHMSLEDFSVMLKTIFQIIDSTGKLQLTGGEPLIHPELPEMIKECFQYQEKFEHFLLITNCTIPIKSELMEILINNKKKILVHVSDYGIKQNIINETLNLLKDNDIAFKYYKYFGNDQYADGWVDQGDFVVHGRQEKELIQIFLRCTHVKRGSWYVRGGQMHRCGRSIRGTELSKIPLRQEDYLDIYAGSLEERREKLHKLMNVKMILACDYCNGLYGTEDKSKRCPAGEQL